MLIVSYSLLGIGAIVSCGLAFRWIGMQWRRCVALSFVAGIICGLVFCLHINLQASIAVDLLFLALYIPIIMQPRCNVIDVIAAVSIACAGYGMLQMTADIILVIEWISPFFRVMLVVICLFAFSFVGRVMSENFPGEDWKEYFLGETVDENSGWGLPRFCSLFVIYGASIAFPVLAGIRSFSVLLLEWFGFFGGLKLIDLIISNRKEKLTILTEIQYRNDMQTYMSVIRSQRHDYNFHVQTLHGLLLQKDYDACEEYLEVLLKDSIEMNQLLPLADAAISALILSFRSKALQQGIQMEIVIENDLSQITTNVYETNKIIGNLLQNAIDETEKLTDKSYGIKLSIIKRGEFCIISVSNRTRDGKPMAAYQVGHSSKEGHEGIGISSIQALASKYGGVIYSRMEEDIIFFIAKVPLRLLKEVV